MKTIKSNRLLSCLEGQAHFDGIIVKRDSPFADWPWVGFDLEAVTGLDEITYRRVSFTFRRVWLSVCRYLWAIVAPEGIGEDAALKRCVSFAENFVKALPLKNPH